MILDHSRCPQKWDRVYTQQIQTLCLILSLYCGLGCDSSQGSLSQSNSPCGTGKPEIFYGLDRPFVPFETLPASWSIEYGLQGGYHIDLSFRFKGQHNPDQVDITLLLTTPEDQSTVNPDLIEDSPTAQQFSSYYMPLQNQVQLQNIEIQDLFQSLKHSFTLFGLHNTQQWYLIFAEPDDILQGCYFYKARIFLYTPQGTIPTASDLRPLNWQTSQLWIRLTTQDQSFLWKTFGVLKWVEHSDVK